MLVGGLGIELGVGLNVFWTWEALLLKNKIWGTLTTQKNLLYADQNNKEHRELCATVNQKHLRYLRPPLHR